MFRIDAVFRCDFCVDGVASTVASTAEQMDTPTLPYGWARIEGGNFLFNRSLPKHICPECITDRLEVERNRTRKPKEPENEDGTVWSPEKQEAGGYSWKVAEGKVADSIRDLL